METLLRYLEMLRFIPKEPKSISTPELLETLQNNGYEVDLRTVQRDLIKLSSSHLFPICSTEGKKPLRWFWREDLTRFQFPMMSVDEALTFKLVETFLEPMLPPAVKSHISVYFKIAEKTLEISPLASWVDKVRIVPNSLSLLPAEIEPAVLNTVYDALFKNCRIHVSYSPFDQKPKKYELNPLGLVFRNNLIYLVATVWEYTDIKQFALHRFQTAKLSKRGGFIPSGFSLDDYISQGGFDYPLDDDEIVLKLKIRSFLKHILSETPLSPEQSITRLDDETYFFQATVKNTEQLRWWIRSFGSSVEVLEPLELREEFIEMAKEFAEIYAS
jgi:predicted DNA-binding transcriptional regulator YafY